MVSSTTTLGSTFGKAAGLGGALAIRSEAPSELGGRVWNDTNTDGIQDGCENGMAGINVSLYESDGTLVATVQTDADGEYYFNHLIDDLTIERNTQYFIVVGEGGQFSTTDNSLNSNFFLTQENTGFGVNADLNDSDGVFAPGGIANDAFTGLPYRTITTAEYGFVDHSSDFGFSALRPSCFR